MDELISVNSNSDLIDKEKDIYITAATSDNTRAAYQSDILHFRDMGFTLPTDPESLSKYLKLSAEKLNPRTIHRRLTSIRKWHQLKGQSDPTANDLVSKTMKGIERLHGKPKVQALALRLKDLDKISEFLDKDETLITKRNKAIILLGFYGALRRSEIANLQWEEVVFENQGIVLTLRNAKTDKKGEGQNCVIPAGRDKKCPVQALLAWRQASKLWEGPVFRPKTKDRDVCRRFESSKWGNRQYYHHKYSGHQLVII